jgi:hypothetical protein
MNLPKNGRVVVIDDDEKEAFPLIRALSKENIPVYYFKGELEELPSSPLFEARIIFLDINLVQGSTNEKTKASQAAGIVDRLVGNNSGPYILIIWAKHDDASTINIIKDHLNKAGKTPLNILNLGKSECKARDYNIEFILETIKNELDKIEFFHILTLWENIVHQSSGEIIKKISRHSTEMGGEWNENMGSIFYSLAEANAGKHIEDLDITESIKNSILPFNNTFLDTLETNINKITTFKDFEGLSFSKSKLDIKTVAKINSKLLISKDGSFSDILPGNVYKFDKLNEYQINLMDFFDYADKEAFNKFCTENELNNKIEYVLLEVSPACDHSQKKWKFSRVIPGFMCVEEKLITKKIKGLSNSDFAYRSPILEIEDNIYSLILDFRCFTSLPFEKLREHSASFRFKHELIVEIQHKLSSHICRPGIVSLRQ